jgi:two-component system aerobic respiration control sensor histidine kinase ArcB
MCVSSSRQSLLIFFLRQVGRAAFVVGSQQKLDEGQGSTFICLVPMKKPLLTDKDIAIKKEKIKKINNVDPTITSQSAAPIKILLVEDNLIAALATQDILKSLGCIVDTANSGKEALAKFTTNPYDIIYMDIGLPDMSGYETTRHIREIEINRPCKTTILALSAHLDASITSSCLEAGMDQAFIKPLLKKQAEQFIKAYRLQTQK